MRLEVPNRHGNLTDVVIGMPTAEDYTKATYQNYNFYLGATIGRYAGRISKGGFHLNNQFISITNHEGVQLHGGVNSIDKILWDVEDQGGGAHPFVIFSIEDKAGSNGYPGNIKLKAKYELTENAIKITYTAKTDAPTVLNVTNHVYFNLKGRGSTEGNELYINANHVLQVDERLVPTGKLIDVHHTPLDYTTEIPLHFEGHYGLDTPFVLEAEKLKASLYNAESGIQMKVFTNQPALVVFTPQDFSELKVRNHETFNRFPAICFECQNFPDAPNHPHFPSSVLLPGETYRNEIAYQFDVK